MSFSRQPCPVWLFTDLDGNICDDTYYAHFLENVFPYIPQAVYQTDQGPDGSAWPNPLQLQANGTLPNNLYFEEGVTYRIEIRQGPTQSDQLIDLIENFQVGEGDTPVPAVSLPVDNQFTNPGFTEVFFEDSYVISNIGNNSYSIAPGWFIDIESSGSTTVTVERIALPGDQNIPNDSPTNPGYALKVTAAGTFTALQLKQRFKYIPGLWTSGGLSVCFTSKVDSGASNVSAYYSPSTGTPELIYNDVVATAWQVFSGGVQLPESDNSDSGSDAYVDVYFTLPTSSTFYITNTQLISSPQSASYPYVEISSERALDQSYNVYHDSELRQPKQNLLTGWTFANNPWQFRSATSSNLANNDYTADQTIIVQQNYVDANTGNNVAVGSLTVADNYDFEVKAVTATNKFAMIQYIDPSTAWPFWEEMLSAMVVAKIKTINDSSVRIKCRVIYRSSLPSTISRTEPIASWDAAAGVGPTLAAGWTAIEPLNDPVYTLTADHEKFVFEKFQLPTADNDAMTLGIMIYTIDAMDTTGTPDSVLFRRVSLVNNDFAIDAPAETFDETLRKCQFYYEKSYPYSTLPGAVNSFPGIMTISFPVTTDGSSSAAYMQKFDIRFKQTKCKASPTMTIYSYAGTSGNITVGVDDYQGAGVVAGADRVITQFSKNTTSPDMVSYYPNNTAAALYSVAATHLTYLAYMFIHYVADARLGK